MEKKEVRLYFIDAMRAWAILMMLQGHFVDGLLDTVFRDPGNTVYQVWKYFRGITAPVFFTVSGFIFTFLLVRNPGTGWDNPRIGKGIKRGLQLLFIGYLLRFNLLGLLKGEIYDSFYLVDVLHCIGLSILGIVAVYLVTWKHRKWVFPTVLLGVTLALFLFEPLYKTWNFSFLPFALENYLSKANGSVFTIIPWLGYAAFGGFLALVFTRFKTQKFLYPIAIATVSLVGFALILYSSDFFMAMFRESGITLFARIYYNNYLFIRLGDVLVVFAVFMLFRSFLKNTTLLRIGRNTLSIYVIHFIILYGSFTGIGLYYYLNHSLTPGYAITGALAFMILCAFLALRYESREVVIISTLKRMPRFLLDRADPATFVIRKFAKTTISRMLRAFGLVKN